MIRRDDLRKQFEGDKERVVDNIKEAIDRYFATPLILIEHKVEHVVHLGFPGFPLTDDIQQKIIAWCKETGGWEATFVLVGTGRWDEPFWDVVLR